MLFYICTKIFINVFLSICLRFQIIIVRKNETKMVHCFIFILQFLVVFLKYALLFPTYFVMLMTFPMGILLVMQSS